MGPHGPAFSRTWPETASCQPSPPPIPSCARDSTFRWPCLTLRQDAKPWWSFPRGVFSPGTGQALPSNKRLRRRFMLLGQTLDGMRVWDIRQALAVARQVIEARPQFELAARRGMSVNALYASLFEEDIQRLDLQAVPQSHREGPDYLGVLKILDVQDAMAVARARGQIR